MQITPDIIQKVSHGDMPTLLKLDDEGIFCGTREDALDFSRRLECLDDNLTRMNMQLQHNGSYSQNGICVTRENRIPRNIFQEAASLTSSLYGFNCTWVPGFFLTESLGWLFGGCALSFFPDFFAIFIVRMAFKKRSKWLFYQRNELLAHECCHIARVALDSSKYEEIFAYQTSFSGFRRLTGGIFHESHDAYWFLGATLFLLVGQALRTFWLTAIPAWPLWLVLLAVLGFFIVRHVITMRTLAHAKENLTELFQPQHVMPVLFRCTDDEIDELAKLSAQDCRTWLERRQSALLRWQIILTKFPRNQ